LILRSLVQELASAGKIIVYSSHVLEIVEKVATDVLILHDSRVVAHDSVAKLRDLLALPSLEQVFRRVVAATDVDQVARDILGVMREGRIVGKAARGATETQVMAMATGHAEEATA
jgi:ABC-2 type transport system ATP-binding protein